MHRVTCLVLVWVATAVVGCRKAEERVVVYCAQDQEFADGVFADFTGETKLVVAPKFDTEANKSVSLAAELEHEVGRPRCDVHWNNEILATIRLARAGVYEPYESPSAAPFPAWTKAKGRSWQAFGQMPRSKPLIRSMTCAASSCFCSPCSMRGWF